MSLYAVLSATSSFELPSLPTFELPTFTPVQKAAPKVSPPVDFEPAPRAPLSVTSPSQLLPLLTGSVGLAARLGSGAFVLGWSPTGADEGGYSLSVGPVKLSDSSSVLASAADRGIKEPLVLYEYEPSPYCKKVREVCCLLDIPVLCKPCPIVEQEVPKASTRGGTTPYVKKSRGGFSDELFEKTGRRTMPYLEDPNNQAMNGGMFESEDIIDYLLETYSPVGDYDPKALWTFRGQFADFTATISTIARGLAGGTMQSNARTDNADMRPIELYGYECSPFVKPVREKLCELGLPHVIVPCSRGSENRAKLVELSGGEQFQVPQIVDPNVPGIGVLAEGDSVVEYLEGTYTMTPATTTV
ncbi:hypothetical protein TrVE_jg10870 [Triparma verrucosa]|uniref:GST N-terminal domain-containing protein n=1 Tax=Triparma verrucosa TaxID=1606542 RepID=A0A9W7BUJ0_9STRA|nr:hypothetical protein TrVE_jg10870 [Triparma verrucosa]